MKEQKLSWELNLLPWAREYIEAYSSLKEEVEKYLSQGFELLPTGQLVKKLDREYSFSELPLKYTMIVVCPTDFQYHPDGDTLFMMERQGYSVDLILADPRNRPIQLCSSENKAVFVPSGVGYALTPTILGGIAEVEVFSNSKTTKTLLPFPLLLDLQSEYPYLGRQNLINLVKRYADIENLKMFEILRENFPKLFIEVIKRWQSSKLKPQYL